MNGGGAYGTQRRVAIWRTPKGEGEGTGEKYSPVCLPIGDTRGVACGVCRVTLQLGHP